MYSIFNRCNLKWYRKRVTVFYKVLRRSRELNIEIKYKLDNIKHEQRCSVLY